MKIFGKPLLSLGFIIFFLTCYQSNSHGQNNQEFIKTMQNAAGRMKQLIEALLEYSRVTRKVRLPEKVSLGPLIEEVLSDMETAIKKSGGSVEMGPLPIIQADPIQMRQLFQNLIGNALKFCRTCKPVIQIDCKEEEDKYLFSLTDNGIGIDPEYSDKIFIFTRGA